MTFKCFCSRVTSWAALAFAALMWCSACVASVERDSSENVAEAQGALQSCGVRGICPTGYGCDYTDLLCHPICPRSGACDDGDPCTVDTCGKGLCYYTPIVCTASICEVALCMRGECITTPAAAGAICGPNYVCNGAGLCCNAIDGTCL